MKLAVVILAGGASLRMGENKAQLKIKSTNFLNYIVWNYIQLQVGEIIVVSGAHKRLDTLIDSKHSKNCNITHINNDNWKSGKVSSVLLGLKQISANCDSIVINPVDCPRSHLFLSQLLNFHCSEKSKLTIPRRNSRNGHPVIYDISLLSDLMNISEEKSGLKEITKCYSKEAKYFNFASNEIYINVNTYEDYQLAKELLIE